MLQILRFSWQIVSVNRWSVSGETYQDGPKEYIKFLLYLMGLKIKSVGWKQIHNNVKKFNVSRFQSARKYSGHGWLYHLFSPLIFFETTFVNAFRINFNELLFIVTLKYSRHSVGYSANFKCFFVWIQHNFFRFIT